MTTDADLIIALASIGMRPSDIARIHFDDLLGGPRDYRLNRNGAWHPIPDRVAAAILERATGFLFPGNDEGHLSPREVSRIGNRALPDGTTLMTLRWRSAQNIWQSHNNSE